jgi:hypothetical protein
MSAAAGTHADEVAPIAQRPISSLTTIELRAELRALGQTSLGSENDLRRRLRECLVQRRKEDAELLAAEGKGAEANGGGSSDDDSSGSNSGGGGGKHGGKKHKKEKSHKKEKKHKKRGSSKDSKKEKKKHKKPSKRKHASASASSSSSSSSEDEGVEHKSYDASGRLTVTKRKKLKSKKSTKGKRWSEKLLKWIPKDAASTSESSEAEYAEDMNIAHPILKRARHKLFGQGLGV